MTKTRFLACLCAFLITLPLLVACAGGETSFKTNVSAEDVVRGASASVPAFSNLSPADTDYVKYRMALDTSDLDSYAVYLPSAGTLLDEIGVLQCTTDDTESARKMAQEYLARRNEEWTGMYLVEEYPKLKDAEVRVFGRYVVYAILSEADKDAFFTSVEQLLKN